MVPTAETREHVDRCRAAFPESVGESEVVFGFDGVVDRVRTVVGERTDPEDFQRMRRMREFGARITDSADLDASCSIEWFSAGTRPGGHAAHLGRAFERLGYAPTLIGTFGRPPVEAFQREYDRSDFVSIGQPSTTDAIEFDDGKVLLNDRGEQVPVDWEHLVDTVGFDALAEHVDGAATLGLGYWATIPRLPSIWVGLAEEIWPVLGDPPERVFVDPGDLRRLSPDLRQDGFDSLVMLDTAVPVTVSANWPESVELFNRFTDEAEPDSMGPVAETVRDGLDVDRFVAHSVSKTVAVGDEGTVTVKVPRCSDPVMTTSAGDHFNAGLVLAHLLDIREGPALVVASSLAGWFVRNGAPPTYGDLVQFVDDYETMFEGSGAY